jgi:hypothetical protein
MRGRGNTVLLGEFYRRAEDRHWMTVIIEANTGTPYVTLWRAPSTPWSESSSAQEQKPAKCSRRHWPPSRRSVRRSTWLVPAYLKAMARDGAGPSQSGEIPARLGKTQVTAGAFRDSLIKKGRIFAPVHG